MAEQVAVNHSIQVRVLTGEPRTKHTSCMQKFSSKKMRQNVCNYSCSCGGMVYTADLKSASLTGLRVRVPSGALLFTENTMVYVVEWFTHQVVALGPFRTMRVRASSYTLILDDKPPPKGRNHLVVKKS